MEEDAAAPAKGIPVGNIKLTGTCEGGERKPARVFSVIMQTHIISYNYIILKLYQSYVCSPVVGAMSNGKLHNN